MQDLRNDEQRSSPRVKIPVYIQTFESSFPLGTLINLSPRGLFVQTTEPKEVDTILDIRFQPPGSEDWVRLKAQVIWANSPPSFHADEPPLPSRQPVQYNPGMGLRILSIAPKAEALLEEFLRTREEEG